MGKRPSAQKTLPRKPRVQLEYDVHLPDGGMVNKELPWVVGVMADLSGSNSDSLGPVEDREWAKDITAENFDTFMKKSNVGIDLAKVPDLISGKKGQYLQVKAKLESIGDLSPDRLAEIIGAEPVEFNLLTEGQGKDKRYVFEPVDPGNEMSGKFTDPVASLDDITPEYVAAKIGADTADLTIKKTAAQDKKRGKFYVLRIEKKGPIAKLLEARREVKELLTKMDVGDATEMGKLLGDKNFLEEFVNAEGAAEDKD